MTDDRDSFFDLQVNGYAGVDFNSDALAAEDMQRACAKLRADGVEQVLATIITDRVDMMCARVRRLVALRERDEMARSIIYGIHIEGPFINPTDGYRGAHPADAILPVDPEVMRRLIDAGNGLVKLVTLAPERDRGFDVIRMLAKDRTIVSAGHTDASLDQLRGAMDAGLSMFTHLGNGCPMTLPRHDNIIQRILSLRDKLWITLIADGVHVPFFTLKNYLDLIGADQAIIITDAIAPAGLGPGRYTLGRWDLTIGADLVARSPDGSHLIGSCLTMGQAYSNLRATLGFSESTCRSILSENPRAALGSR